MSDDEQKSNDELSGEIPANIRKVAQPFFEPIGEYIFLFGRLEATVDHTISALMEVKYHQTGQYITTELDFLSRVFLIRAFCRRYPLNIKDLLKQLENQNTFRNNLVHGPWTAYRYPNFQEKHGSWQKPRLSRRHHQEFFHVTIEDIKDGIEALKHLSSELKRLQADLPKLRIAAAQAPSPDKTE